MRACWGTLCISCLGSPQSSGLEIGSPKVFLFRGRTTDFYLIYLQLRDSIQQPFGYWPNALATRLHASTLVLIHSQRPTCLNVAAAHLWHDTITLLLASSHSHCVCGAPWDWQERLHFCCTTTYCFESSKELLQYKCTLSFSFSPSYSRFLVLSLALSLSLSHNRCWELSAGNIKWIYQVPILTAIGVSDFNCSKKKHDNASPQFINHSHWGENPVVCIHY